MIGIDEFITEEWYPGFAPSFGQSPYVVEPFRSFTKVDEGRFWFLDFHWAGGLTPLGMIWNEDGFSWGTQLAAEQMPLPTGRGMTQRIAGTHTYASVIPVRSQREVEARVNRMRTYLPGFLERFDEIWRHRRAEIEIGWHGFRSREVSALSDTELAGMLREARSYYRRLFEIHFEMMYPLLSNYLGFRGVCRELGIETAEVSKFLQGYDTKIMETDRAVWQLATDARAAGLEAVFARTTVDRLPTVLGSEHRGRAWLHLLDIFLEGYGFRTAGTADVALPSWVEDPRPVLRLVAEFLRQEHPHDFIAAQNAAVEQREAAIDTARSMLTRREQRVFDDGLISVQQANFPWWQDDHNHYIDLRASLPLRWVALELAERIGADRFDDTMFLFWPELVALADHQRSYYGMRPVIAARRQYFEHWRARRGEMPKVLGAVPDSVDDPLLIEVYGLDSRYLRAVRDGPDSAHMTLRGVPAARGSARGRARVLREASDLDQIRTGEVLVCESTSASWTLVFGRIAACVCDSGGALSHAAIVGREYGVPTVTGCGIATSAIHDGDELHVEGTTGIVTILRRLK